METPSEKYLRSLSLIDLENMHRCYTIAKDVCLRQGGEALRHVPRLRNAVDRFEAVIFERMSLQSIVLSSMDRVQPTEANDGE